MNQSIKVAACMSMTVIVTVFKYSSIMLYVRMFECYYVAMRNEKENENENNESDDDAFLAKMHLFKKFPIASQSFFIRDSNTRITYRFFPYLCQGSKKALLLNYSRHLDRIPISKTLFMHDQNQEKLVQ